LFFYLLIMRILFFGLVLLLGFNTCLAQYDWTRKADFGGVARYAPCSFSIGSKGYMCMGVDQNYTSYNDLWEYDPVKDTWTEKQSCPAPARYAGTSFVIGGQAYICFGATNSYNFYNDLWMYDQATDTWAQKKSFPGIVKYGASAFTIASKGYVGTGNQGSATGPFTNEFWEYDPATDNWTKKADLPGPTRYGSIGLTIGNRGFMGMGGRKDQNIYTLFNDWYEYLPASDKWIKKADIPTPGISYPARFSIGGNGYIGAGNSSSGALNDFWQYSPATDSWTQVASFKGNERYVTGSFGIGDKGYTGIGLGSNSSYCKDFWEYGPQTKIKADFLYTIDFCATQPQVFSSLESNPVYKHYWRFDSGAVPATSDLKDPTGIMYITDGLKHVTHIISDGVNTDSITYTVTVHPLPKVSFLISTSPLCNNTPMTFTNTGSSNKDLKYKWDFGDGHYSFQENVEHMYEVSGTKTIQQIITTEFGCTASNTQTLFINASPKAVAGKSITVCSVNPVQLGEVPITGNTYQWVSASPINDPQMANPVVIPLPGKNVYSLTVTNAVGCPDEDETTITVLNALIVDAGLNDTICENESVQLGTTYVNNYRYSWLPKTDLSATTIYNPVATPKVTTTYTLSVIQDGCPAVTDVVTVVVHTVQPVDAGVNDTIDAISTSQLKVTGGTAYTWSPPDGLTDWKSSDPVASPKQTTTYSVSSVNKEGCMSSDSVTIFVFPLNVWIPNAFTPDDDDCNDVFFVKALYISDFELSIFNRWGECIFYSTDIHTGWDGYDSKTLQRSPIGSYTCLVKGKLANKKLLHLKGVVNLIR
jgi:gliding motility-associated-like protein